MVINEISFEEKIGTLTINENAENVANLSEIVYAAIKYFPKGTWSEVEYFGNIKIKHKFQIKLQEKVFGALIFEEMIGKLKEMKNILGFKGLLLALTHDPLIRINYYFEGGRFKRFVSWIHDYVVKTIGVVSFFKIEEETTIMVTAHGLGHNQGLAHHLEPVDLMYVGLLENKPIKKIGFCEDCEQRLEKKVKL